MLIIPAAARSNSWVARPLSLVCNATKKTCQLFFYTGSHRLSFQSSVRQCISPSFHRFDAAFNLTNSLSFELTPSLSRSLPSLMSVLLKQTASGFRNEDTLFATGLQSSALECSYYEWGSYMAFLSILVPPAELEEMLLIVSKPWNCIYVLVFWRAVLLES